MAGEGPPWDRNHRREGEDTVPLDPRGLREPRRDGSDRKAPQESRRRVPDDGRSREHLRGTRPGVRTVWSAGHARAVAGDVGGPPEDVHGGREAAPPECGGMEEDQAARRRAPSCGRRGDPGPGRGGVESVRIAGGEPPPRTRGPPWMRVLESGAPHDGDFRCRECAPSRVGVRYHSPREARGPPPSPKESHRGPREPEGDRDCGPPWDRPRSGESAVLARFEPRGDPLEDRGPHLETRFSLPARRFERMPRVRDHDELVWRGELREFLPQPAQVAERVLVPLDE